jgi:hypothetical protein
MLDLLNPKDKLKKIMSGGFCAFWMFPKGVIMKANKITDESQVHHMNELLEY